MSCSLTPVSLGVQYKAKVGSQVTVELRAAKNAGVRIVKIGYDGQIDGEPPFQFDVKHGPRLLTVLVTALELNAMIRIVETCGNSEVEILKYKYKRTQDPRSVIVDGI